jgi:predicted dehydrogenase
MGNQGYSNPGARECAEIIWSGEIGNVTELHAWTDRPGKYWPQNPDVDPKPAPVPATLDWNAWLGASPDRPYSPAIAPHHWRAYPEYGCGAIGDMACHIMGTPNMALRLSLSGPTSVECIKKEGVGKHTFPHRTVIRFDFPARGPLPPVKVFWHDSLKEFLKFDGIPAGELIGDKDNNGSLFIGDKGMVTTGCYGERTRLLPDARMKDYKLPAQLLTRSPGHYRDWLRACKGGEPACSNFSVAGPFVQWMLLGSIAMRYEGKLDWDNAAGRFTNNAEANEWLKPKFRKGWHFVG